MDGDPQEANKMAAAAEGGGGGGGGEPKLTWSVLRHRQLSGDVLPKKKSCCDAMRTGSNSSQGEGEGQQVPSSSSRTPRRDSNRSSFPLSLVRTAVGGGQFTRRRFQNDHPAPSSPCDPLSEMARVKAEESVQEWLARIGESGSHWPQQQQQQQEEEEAEHRRQEDEDEEAARKGRGLLLGASKASPANVPVVVMQCSRLHTSHHHQQSSSSPHHPHQLPMGTLVTALYRESDWLYVQTPHGVEGFVSSDHCAPIGNNNNSVRGEEAAAQTRRPWEPCDLPVQVSRRHQEPGARQQQQQQQQSSSSSYVLADVRAKAGFYGDRPLGHAPFHSKARDPIRTAKTVTDILRSSPDAKVCEAAAANL